MATTLQHRASAAADACKVGVVRFLLALLQATQPPGVQLEGVTPLVCWQLAIAV